MDSIKEFPKITAQNFLECKLGVIMAALINKSAVRENDKMDNNNISTKDLDHSLEEDCDGIWERIGRFKIKKNEFQIGRFSVSIKEKTPCSIIGRFICQTIPKYIVDIDTDDCENDVDIDTDANIDSTIHQETMEMHDLVY